MHTHILYFTYAELRMCLPIIKIIHFLLSNGLFLCRLPLLINNDNLSTLYDRTRCKDQVSEFQHHQYHH